MANLSGNTDFSQSVILSPVFSIVGRGTTENVLQAYFTTSLKASCHQLINSECCNEADNKCIVFVPFFVFSVRLFFHLKAKTLK